MNIALVFPPLYGVDMPPLGIAYIASQLISDGHKVSVFCFNSQLYVERKDKQFLWDWENSGQWTSLEKINKNFNVPNLVEKWAEAVLERSPKIIGLSVNSHSRILANLLADTFKKKAKDACVIFGGPFCAEITEPEELNSNVDVYVRGEGEKIISRITGIIERGESIGDSTIEGTLVNTGAGFKDNGWDTNPLDINDIPLPALQLFDLGRYINKVEIPIIFSRGCNYSCAFCTDAPMWGRYRMRSADDILEEMAKHSRLFCRRRFKCSDLMVNGDLERLEQLADKMITGGDIFEWGGMARARIEMSQEFLCKMKKAGGIYFTYGIESGAARVLAHMGKPLKRHISQVLRRTHDSGIKVNTLWMAGYPAERWSDIIETMIFLFRNRKYIDEFVSVSSCYIPHKSRLWREQESLNIRYNNKSEWYIKGKNSPWVREVRKGMLFGLAKALGVYRGGIS
ncbi:MAG: radical SAM protein [Candidatus Omnitrophica bacterium]|nr:radical SAM protein [Candidatus Omnitrophota bacterium]MBU1924075.1 radical SAM protein [Candidatus Omnitrophota bacterium]